jgi:hypothetical protein
MATPPQKVTEIVSMDTSNPRARVNNNIFFNRDGTITGKAGFTTAASYGAPVYAIGSAHPNDSSAFLAQYGLTWDEAGFIVMEGDYVGVWSTTNYLVDGVAATQQDPIETCATFESIATTANGASFDPTSGLFLGWRPIGQPGAYTGTDQNIINLVGHQSYFAGGFVVRTTNASTSSSDVTNAIETYLGLATSTVVAGIITYAYGYPAFLCTNVTYKEVPIGSGSATFTITIEYTFAPPNGWNPLIYATSPY